MTLEGLSRAWPLLRLALAAALPLTTRAERWVLIAATTHEWENYRHQADACHAYNVVKARGIPEERIIMFAYDDVARTDANPLRGKLFNKPDPAGPGHDVYEGCHIDYSGADVNVSNFLGALTGRGLGRKVLRSTAEDHVFVYLVDHGAPGLIVFPNEYLHKLQLQEALSTMKKLNMFKKLVFYLETCYSGSMFEGMDISGVYAVSAARADEESAAEFCPDYDGPTTMDMVNGEELGTCLGDLFSVSWLEDVEANGTANETLESQFNLTRAKTTKSNVTQWGDLTFKDDSIADFIGSDKPRDSLGVLAPAALASSTVPALDADLQRLRAAAARATASPAAGALLEKELGRRQAAEAAYHRFARFVYPGDDVRQSELWKRVETPNQPECEVAVHDMLRRQCSPLFDANSAFALSFHQVVVNACADARQGQQGLSMEEVVEAARSACSSESILI